MMRCVARTITSGLGGLILALALLACTAQAAELLMFEERGCPWCRRWHAEVGVAYPKTPEGRRAPLRRVDLGEARPVGVRFTRPINVSPTFVLIEDGREVDRITGYPGADFFWGMLGEMLDKLKKTSGSVTGRVAAVVGHRPGQSSPTARHVAQSQLQP